MPLLCQQPLFHPRTEAISGSNWSQLTLKWPQFLGGRRVHDHHAARVAVGPHWRRFKFSAMTRRLIATSSWKSARGCVCCMGAAWVELDF